MLAAAGGFAHRIFPAKAFLVCLTIAVFSLMQADQAHAAQANDGSAHFAVVTTSGTHLQFNDLDDTNCASVTPLCYNYGWVVNDGNQFAASYIGTCNGSSTTCHIKDTQNYCWTATKPANGLWTGVSNITDAGIASANSCANPPLSAPTVTGLSPTTGAETGGTTVTVSGTTFIGVSAVKFGGVDAASFSVNSSTEIIATSPAGSGTVDVTVTAGGGSSAESSNDQFTYLPAPTVTSLSPTTGPAVGGTSVVITGTNLTGATAVHFGSTDATNFTVVDATQINATSPAGSGTVNVTVTTGGGTSATGTGNEFIYPQAQTITFPAIADTNYGLVPPGNFTRTIEMQATSDSGLGVTEYTTNDNAICKYQPYNTGNPSAGVGGIRQNIVITGVGDCTVTAAQSGNANYEAATPVQRSFNIDKGSQIIVPNGGFTTRNFVANDTFTVNSVAVTGGGSDFGVAGSSSELAVAYSSDTPSVCTVSDTTPNPYFANPAVIYFSNATVTVLTPGTCTLTLTQAGDEHYYAASEVQKSITINAPALTTTLAVASSTFSAGTNITPFTPVTASGGFGTLGFAVAPTLPSGLAIDPLTGEVSGSTTAASAQASYTVTVTDSTPGTVQTSSKQFSLEITADKTKPVIDNVPADISVGNDPGLTTAIVTWTEPNADDNIGVTSFTSDHHSGDAFPLGKTKVTYTAKDAEDNTTTASFSVTVTDADAPTVASITRHNPAAETTDADSLTWRVTFSENVQNVDTTDFEVKNTTATITDVSQVNASTYDVTASGGDLANLNATVNLGILGTQDIKDLANNALADPTPTGTDENSYIVRNDVIAPTVQILNAPSSFADLSSFTLTFQWSEEVTGFTLGDITVGNGSASNFVTVDGDTYTADITPTGAGDVTIDVAANVAKDLADNDNDAATQVTVGSTIVKDTQQVISIFITNRLNNMANNQPDLGSLLNGSFGAGGEMGNLTMNATSGHLDLAFATSLSHIERSAQRNLATALAGSKATADEKVLAIHRRIMGNPDTQNDERIVTAFATDEPSGEATTAGEQRRLALGYADDGASDNDKQAMDAVLARMQPGKDNIGGKSRGEQEAMSTSAYGNDDDTAMPANRFDVWTQIQGSTTRAGDADSSLWIGYAGAHYFVTKDLIVGALVQFDWADERNASAGSSADGTGWMVGPYLAGRVAGSPLAYEARAAWGRSSNTVSPLGTYRDDFDTTRWMASGKIGGNFKLGTMTVAPSVRVSYFEETQESYVDSLSNTIPGQTVSLGEVRFGPEFSWELAGADGSVVRPKLGVSGVWNFNVRDGASSQGFVLGEEELRTRLDAGLAVTNTLGWNFLVEGYYDGLGIEDYRSVGGKVRLVVPFH